VRSTQSDPPANTSAAPQRERRLTQREWRDHALSMLESRFDQWVAERYDASWPELFEPTVIESTVAFLAQYASALGGSRFR
jgi:hypothetical protein